MNYALYESSWETFTAKECFEIRLLMIQLSKPARLTVGPLGPINYELAAVVCIRP